jgi:electron transfer flavoprotein-quinone oxidoreductase
MDKVQCVVVGAGPTGSACALSLARKGIETVLLERGAHAGEKNVASFVLFTPVLRQLIPDFEEEAPLERLVDDQSFIYMGEKDFFQIRMRFQGHADKRLAYTAYRSKFDSWFAEKAKEAGAELLTNVLVTDVLVEDGRVVGVKVGDEELLADVVVGADGIHTVVGRQAGLVSDDIRTYLLGVKEILDLDPGVIEERFQLEKGKGVVYETFGYPLDDITGASTLYTNNDSLSIAVFGWIDAIKERGIDMHDRLQQLKEHPFIHSLVAGSKLREYQAHIISNGGRMELSDLYSDGVLLCGEAGGFNDYLYIGVPPGMLSGMMAANTVEYAVKKGDYSAETMKEYIAFLEKTSLLRLLNDSRRASKYLVKGGRKTLPAHVRNVVEIIDKSFEDEVTYLNPEPYAAGLEFYFRVVENWVPGLLRKPIRAVIKALSLLSSALNRRKVRKALQ